MVKNAPARFTLNGGHPVLDLVNTLDNRFREDGPVELLESYADLIRFMQQSGLLAAAPARLLMAAAKEDAQRQALRAALILREAIAAVLYCAVEGSTPSADQLRKLERFCLDAYRHRQLRWQHAPQSGRARAGAQWVFGTDVELPVWMLAQAASELMASVALDRMRACGSESCRWLFLDASKNHTRRWCDMKICGNRMKARRFSARRRA